MNSKNIHTSFRYYSNEIEWEMHGQSEWVYIGAKDKINEAKTVELIDTFFDEDELYLITDRHNSFLIQKPMAFTKIMEFLEVHNPAIANQDFSKIMEFNKIGIARKGNKKGKSKETTAGINT